MKASSVKKAAKTYSSEQLDAAIAAVMEEEREILEIEGDDMGERLTHLLLARRIRGRVDAGETLKDAFRAELGAVRETLAND